MGSKNGKPVLRDQDVQALVKSSGLSEDQVSNYHLPSQLGISKALAKASGLSEDPPVQTLPSLFLADDSR
jgi:hypothetical protein